MNPTTEIPAPELYKWYRRKEPSVMECYANIMEDFMANEMLPNQLAVKYNMPIYKISRILSLYWAKPDFELNIMSRV